MGTKRKRDSELDAYMAAVNRVKLLSAEEERDLGRRYRSTGDLGARKRLAEANLRFVVKTAHRWAYRTHLPLSDLVQEGNLGLLRAIETYDPDRGYRLLTYARHWIEVFVRRALMRGSVVRRISCPLEMRLFFQWGAIENSWLKGQKKGKVDDLDIEEIAQELGVSPARLTYTLTKMQTAEVSLDAPLNAEGATLIDVLHSDADRADEVAAQTQFGERLHRAIVDAAVQLLSPRERVILNRRVLSATPASLQKLGNELGVSRERVRQVEGRVLHKMREPLRAVIDDFPLEA